MTKPKWQTEFPDFPKDSVPVIPAGFGFEDTSWHNDSSPSFTSEIQQTIIWIDHPVDAEREHPGGKRFMVENNSAGIGRGEIEIETDNWSDVLAYITGKRLSNAELLAHFQKLADDAKPQPTFPEGGNERNGKNDWGSARQQAAENDFFGQFDINFHQLNTKEFEAWCLKATSEEMIDDAMARIKAYLAPLIAKERAEKVVVEPSRFLDAFRDLIVAAEESCWAEGDNKDVLRRAQDAYAFMQKPQITEAIKCDDLDAALRFIMCPLGITDGGVAGVYFSGRFGDDDEDANTWWPKASHQDRLEAISGWLRTEVTYALPDDGQ